MPKLNQIIAVVSGQKTRTEKEFGDLNKVIQKADLFHGISRTYKPLDDTGGEELPPESKQPQKNAIEIVDSAKTLLTKIIDAIATQETGNTEAKADIKVASAMTCQVLAKDVPVTVLLFLEKQLNDLSTFVGNFPVLDPAEVWVKNEQNGQYRTEPTRTLRTKKVKKPLVLVQPTKEHPAQSTLIEEDITVGHWTTTKTATVFSAKEKQGIVSRIQELLDAVKTAREEANSIEVKQVTVAAPLLKYIFG